MKIRRFYGKDMRDALSQVKEELGGDAVIMSQKKVADGIEVVAAYDKEPAKPVAKPQQPRTQAPAPVTPLRQKSDGASANANKSPSLSEIIGDEGQDSLRALLEKQGAIPAQPQASAQPAAQAQATAQAQSVTNEPAPSQAQPSADKGSMDDIRQELASLRNVLEFQVSGLMKQQRQQERPLHDYLIERLKQMGISDTLAEEVVSYAPANCEERDAWKFLLKLLANKIHTSNNDIVRNGGVAALVGPTGTGKTTTIAKLAAQYARRHGSDKVALITIDSYRIAAYEQLATYGKIIGCQVKKAATAEDLSDLLHQFRHKGLVLIDTAGFGQRDARLIKQLDTLNQSGYASINHYLVMAANAQRRVMTHTLETYGQIPLKGCILSKLDECYSLGEAVSVAIEQRLPVSYLTDGQRVPEDIKAADAKYLVSCAARLYKQFALGSAKTRRAGNSAVSV